MQNDFITWMVRESFKRDTEDETSVYALAYRVVLLNFAGKFFQHGLDLADFPLFPSFTFSFQSHHVSNAPHKGLSSMLTAP